MEIYSRSSSKPTRAARSLESHLSPITQSAARRLSGPLIFSTEGKLLKTPLIQDVVSEEVGVIAGRPDTVLHGSITAPDRMGG